MDGSLVAYISQDRRAALAHGADLPERTRGAGPCDRAGRQSPNMMMELRNVWHYNPPLTCPYQ